MTDIFAHPDAPCVYCARTPRSGAWNEPCPTSDDRLHWTPEMRAGVQEQKIVALAQSTRRAALELEKAAAAIEGLPDRTRRKLRGTYALNPDLLRNEAERARDTLHVYGLLDV
jgi:hypothetical protein